MQPKSAKFQMIVTFDDGTRREVSGSVTVKVKPHANAPVLVPEPHIHVDCHEPLAWIVPEFVSLNYLGEGISEAAKRGALAKMLHGDGVDTNAQ